MRQAHLRETQLLGDAADQLLVPRIGVGVHQAHRQRLDSLLPNRGQLGSNDFRIRAAENLAVGGDPFVDLDHRGEQRLRLADGQLEELRPVLITDPQDVAEAAGGDQRSPGPAAGERALVPRVVPRRTTSGGKAACGPNRKR